MKLLGKIPAREGSKAAGNYQINVPGQAIMSTQGDMPIQFSDPGPAAKPLAIGFTTDK